MRRPDPPRAPTTRVGADIVDAILTATEAELEAVGVDKLTTNRVAERAGVSVGSLYQYFPNKDAILAELARRLERRSEGLVLEVLEASAELTLEETTARIVDALLRDLGRTSLRRAILREVPRGWTADTSSSVDGRVRERVREVLAARGDVRPGPHLMMAWVISHAIEGAIEAAVDGDPALVQSPALRDELIELILRYLRA